MKPWTLTLLSILAAVPAAAKPGLWCATRPSDLVFDASDAQQRLILYIVIDNLTGAPLDVTQLKTSLSLDGKALPNWGAIMASGADASWKALPAGRHLQFGVNLSDKLRKPGAHTLRLSGDCPANEARLLTLSKPQR